ncbi:MAG: nucleotidyltransferase family protein [Anaerolineae bacterium]
MFDQTYQLLAACAYAEAKWVNYEGLAQQASQFTAWEDLPAQAEAYGLGPLLYTYLKQAGVALPAGVQRELQGLYLRHRHANEVKARVLGKILAAFHSAGIETCVLKGAALAHLIYPQPGLRPMRDLDLLVKKSEALKAQALLAELDFVAPVPTHLPDKHLPAATCKTEGLSVSVELHHNLFNAAYPASLTLEESTIPALTFAVNGQSACTLGYEELLWHLCEHVTYHTNVWESLRLIWVADIVGLAEHFAAEIDWPLIKQRYPVVMNVLSLFHFITPLSPTLQAHSGLMMDRTLTEIGFEFEGWPRTSIRQQRLKGKGYGRILADTFCPSELWLRLHYRLNASRSIFWQRWLLHPSYIFSRINQLLQEKVLRP